MEKPFLFTDLIPPDEDTSKYDDEMRVMVGLDKGSIPIRTWNTGSPFSIKKAFSNKDTLEDSIDSRVGVSSIYLRKDNEDEEDDGELLDEDISFEGMLNYKSKSPGDEDGDEEEEEDGEEDGDNNEEDVMDNDDDDMEYVPSYDDNDIESFKLNNNYRVSTPLVNNNGFMKQEEEEQEDDDQQGESEYYDDDDFAQEDEDDDNNTENADTEKAERILNKMNKLNQLKLSPRVKEFIDYYSTESNYMNTQESKESEELINIMNEYNDLVNYLETPRGEITKQKQSSVLNKQQIIEKKKSKIVIESDFVDQNYNDKKVNKNKIIKEVKEPKVKKQQVIDEDQQELKQIRQKKVKSEIEEKNKAKLAEIVEKRRQEEEEIIQQEMKAKAKRKKFKEALLEKAMRSRRATFGGETLDDEVIPSFLAPTKAFQVQSVSKSAKQQVVLTDDDLIRQEEEKREKIAELRRKFKEQHKKILMSLASKNKESEKMNEDNLLKEQKKKEKHKIKVLKILHSRTEGKDGGGEDLIESYPVETKMKSEKPKRVVKIIATDDSAAGVGSSASSAVRNQGVTTERNYTTVKNKSNQESEKEEDTPEAIELRKLSQKLQQAKVAAYLSSLSEQKKKDELEKKKKEERAKKRISLLSGRVLLEAAERKLMNTHDKPRYQQSQLDSSKMGSNSSKMGNTAKQPAENKKISSEMADAMSIRLTSKVSKSGQESNGQVETTVQARDFADWKRKNSVPSDGKVFAMTGWYPCVKQALLDRGWFYNPDPLSQYFNLKWTLRSIDVCQDTLQPWQFTNHYLKNVAITTKAGLIKSLRSLVWLADVDANDVIPRGYDLSTPDETQAFIDDFRCQKAECILKKLYKKLTGLDKPPLDMTSRPSTSSSKPSSSSKSNRPSTAREMNEFVISPVPPLLSGVVLSDININKAVLDAVYSILEKQIRPYADTYIDNNDAINSAKLVTDLEWELIGSYNIDTPVKSLPSFAPDPIDLFLREKEDLDSKQNASQLREKRRQQKIDQDLRDIASTEISLMKSLEEKDLVRIHNILSTLFYYGKSQNGLNGKGNQSNNMWIVKPAAKSRGRGIATFMDLPKLLRYVEAGSGFSTQWVVQKYMENPLIIGKRKFDLRQWVLVTDWNPLTVYFYDEFYARFSVEEYSNDVNDLDNSFVHLVNNSIGKNSENFGKVFTAENGEDIEGYMWSYESFKKYIEDQTGSDYVTERIQPRMKDIAKWSLMCASEMIEHRKNSWELYGFDFMVDDDYNAWLIEINSSPACDYSTKVTERYVQKALVEILSVVFDCREWDAQPKKTRGSKPDTGGWVNIYEGPLLDMPVGAFGLDMSIKGEAFKSLPKKTFQNSSNIVFSNDNNSLTNSPNRNSSKRLVTSSPPGSPVNKQRQSTLPRRISSSNTSSNTPPASPTNKSRVPLNTKRSNIGNSPPVSPANKQTRKPTLSGRRVLSGNSNKIKTDEDNNISNPNDEFNDSDDESMKEEKRNKNTNHISNNTVNNKNKATPSAVSAIPIKVFSVDF